MTFHRSIPLAFALAAACGGNKDEAKKAPDQVAAAAPGATPAPAPAPTPAPAAAPSPTKPVPMQSADTPAAPAQPADKPADNKPDEPKFDFDKLSHDEKMKFMKEKVVPAMKEEFQKFDAKKFAKFDCKTCHGKDPKKAKYKMPNPDLPKLDFAALKAGKQEPKMAEFMGKVVKPKMAALLEQPEYTEQNPKGFGCLECHEVKK